MKTLIITGTLGGDATVFETKNGLFILNLSVYVRINDENTDIVSVKKFYKTNPSDKMLKAFSKGSVVSASGVNTIKQYTSKEGEIKFSEELLADNLSLNYSKKSEAVEAH